MSNPRRLCTRQVGRVGGACSSVTQRVVFVEGRDKTDHCVKLLQETAGKVINNTPLVASNAACTETRVLSLPRDDARARAR